MLSIQELENLNADTYKETPEVLIDLSEELLFNKKYEKAIELREKAIKFSIEKNNGNEKDIKCAPFYVHYGDSLIIKIMETQDLFNNPGENEEKNQEKDAENNEKPKNGYNNIDENFIANKNAETNYEEEQEDGPEIADEDQNINQIQNEPENVEEDLSQEDCTDEDVASDNLVFAESIYLEYLKDYLNNDDSCTTKKVITEDIKNNLFGLAEVYLKMGDLETCKSDFQLAVEKYLKALKIRKEYDNKFSRIIAEIYFNLAKVYDFDAKKCMVCFVKARLIMEFHIKNKLIEAGKTELADKINIDESILDKEEINHKTVKLKNEIYYNNDEFLKETLPTPILDLADIIKQLDLKIEDVIIDIEMFEKLTKETDKKEEIQTNFTNNYDETKVVDVKALGLVKKRERKDLEKPVLLNQKENSDENKQNVSIKKTDEVGEKIFKFDGYEEVIKTQEEN